MINPKDPAHSDLPDHGITIELEIASRLLAAIWTDAKEIDTNDTIKVALFGARKLIEEANRE